VRDMRAIALAAALIAGPRRQSVLAAQDQAGKANIERGLEANYMPTKLDRCRRPAQVHATRHRLVIQWMEWLRVRSRSLRMATLIGMGASTFAGQVRSSTRRIRSGTCTPEGQSVDL